MPTKYRPEYCRELIDHMSEGYSFESFTAVASVHKDTLYEWVKVHPEFKEAKDTAFSKNMLFYEKVGCRGMLGEIDGWNVTAWIFNMKNRHGWRDRQPEEVDKTIINNNNQVAKLSDDELDQAIEKEIEERVQQKLKAMREVQ